MKDKNAYSCDRHGSENLNGQVEMMIKDKRSMDKPDCAPSDAVSPSRTAA